MNANNRWHYLNEHKIDVLLNGDTYTIEREIREVRDLQLMVSLAPASVCHLFICHVL